MSSLIFSLPEIFSNYKKWVSDHPQMASDFETTVKWVSYFIAGRINNSTVVSELVYCLSNLLVLFNDRIISKARKLEIPGSGDRLKLWLTILEYSEVFLELSAKKIWGEAGRWFIIVIVQVFKCISRLVLLFYHKTNLIENPPIPILKRRTLVPEQKGADFNLDARNQLESIAFVLKRSGKVIRKVEHSPPIHLRNWKPVTLPKIQEQENGSESQREQNQKLISQQLFAEALYALKPLIHLSSVYKFGNNTWKPWAVSLVTDLLSLQIHKQVEGSSHFLNNLTPRQKLQLSRRYFSLLLYLLRSPFFDRYTRDRLFIFLKCLGRKVPLANLICSPLVHYIPHWQKTYFYMWST